MYLNLLFTKKQLLNYYMNINSVYTSVNRNNSYYLLGLYYNSSVVNLNLAIFKIKKSLSLMFTVCVKSHLNILIVNILANKFLSKSFVKIYKKNFLSYFIGNWWHGLLKNFKKFTRYKNKRTSQYTFYKKRFPVFVFYINFKKFHKLDYSAETFNSEINRASVLNLMFVDSSINMDKAPSVVLQNVRNNINNIFLNKLVLSSIRKAFFVRKKKFLLFSYKKYSVFKIHKKFRKVFFEYYFCKFNKTNFFKKIKWD